MFVIWNTFVKG